MKSLKNACIFMLNILVILQCNTLIIYFIVNKYFLLAICGIVAILFLAERRFEMDKNKLYIIFMYLFCMGVLFVLSDFKDIEFLFSIVASFVLFFVFFDNGEIVETMFESYSIIMFLIAAISVFFFAFGTLFNLIEPTGYYSNDVIKWGNLNYTSFYHLYYECQPIEAFGYVGMRNTAIFVEAPMFVYPLTIAIYYELFLRKKGYRSMFFIVYFLAMLTSFSTTGLLALVAMLYLKFYEKFKETNFSKYVVTPGLVVIVILGACYIFYDKTVRGAHSVGVRGDDIIGSIKCFLDNPIAGIGFEKMAELNQYCVIERPQPSLSTGMGAVFAFGGILLGSWYAIPIIVAVYKYIFYPGKRNVMGLVILSGALLCVTIVYTRVLCTMMNAISWLIILEFITFDKEMKSNVDNDRIAITEMLEE